jgi:broad specificity phosphatase PhoE
MTVDRPTLLVLVRHAESARNVAKKENRFLDDEARKAVQGVADPHVPITDEGRRQAQVTGRALRSDFGAFDYVYHSGYRRTQKTAEHLLAAYSEYRELGRPSCHDDDPPDTSCRPTGRSRFAAGGAAPIR